jgi:hypothetical protein
MSDSNLNKLGSKYSQLKNYIISLLDKFNYLTAPLAYKIVFDKYRRPELYSKLVSKEITQINEKDTKALRHIEFENLKDFSECENFEEHLIYHYYEGLSFIKKSIIGIGLVIYFQYLFLNILNSSKLDDKMFVFLDNNRAIFNRLMRFHKNLQIFIKFNYGLCKYIFLYFVIVLAIKMYYKPKEQEENILENYKRTQLIYKKLFLI